MATELACEQAPSEGSKKIQREREKKSGERGAPLSSQNKNSALPGPRQHSALSALGSLGAPGAPETIDTSH